ncbi:hypothetical protein [Aquimarina sediminis]|uniref:hypothetical protein n=1 Tax=Aquimarina sediminis TaxID=2070536 RepID=UPI000CA00489|nr:hypothetical protein [Aquimarina sediminis]
MEEQYKDIKYLVKEAGVDQPSSGFMKAVMNQIEVSEGQQVKAYKPLISNKNWLVIGVITLILVGVIPFLPDNKESFFTVIDFSFFDKVNLQNPFSDFTFHKSTIYGILFLAILFFVQIPILKRRIDKDYSL